MLNIYTFIVARSLTDIWYNWREFEDDTSVVVTVKPPDRLIDETTVFVPLYRELEVEEESRQLQVSKLRRQVIEARQRMNPCSITVLGFLLHRLGLLPDILQGHRFDAYCKLRVGDNFVIREGCQVKSTERRVGKVYALTFDRPHIVPLQTSPSFASHEAPLEFDCYDSVGADVSRA